MPTSEYSGHSIYLIRMRQKSIPGFQTVTQRERRFHLKSLKISVIVAKSV